MSAAFRSASAPSSVCIAAAIRAVQALAPRDRQVGKERLADLLMHERIERIAPSFVRFNQGRAFRLLERVQQLILLEPSGGEEELEAGAPAGDGGRGERPAGGVTDPFESAFNDQTYGRWHIGVSDRDAFAPATVLIEQEAELLQVQEHLFDEERVALGLVEHQGDKSRRCRPPRVPFKQHRDVVPGERSESDLDGEAPAGQVLERARERAARRDITGTEARDEEQRYRRAELREGGDELQTRLIGPVEVLEAQEQRLAQRGALDEAAHAVQQIPAFLIRGEHWRFANVVVDAVQLRHQTGDLGGLLAQYLAKGLGRERVSRMLQLLHERLVGRWRVHVETVTDQHRHPPFAGELASLPDETALARARLPGHEHHSSLIRHRLRDLLCDELAFVDSTHERRPFGVGEHLIGAVVDNRHLEEPPRRVDPLELELAAIDELGPGGAEHTMHRLRGKDPARGRERLDPLRDVYGLAVQVAALRDYLARVKTDAHQRLLVGLAPVAVGHRELEFPCVRDSPTGGLERDHEAVARAFDHDAAMAVDQRVRALLDFAKDQVRPVVTVLLVELRRVDEIREEDRDRTLGQPRFR